MRDKQLLKLKGKTTVYIDWANVYGWKKSLKRVVSEKKLFEYLKSYKDIKNINFYFGTDSNKKSKEFLSRVKKVGYNLTTKPVKYICIAEIDDQKIFNRKCDFDIEICIDVHKALNENVDSFIFFSGDGDFAPVYNLLISKGKQVIVVYARGHLGREVWEMKRGIFKIELKNLMSI